MPLRDDHDAAIARADALQRELDQERASDSAQAERLGHAEKELAAARERLVRAEAELERARREARPRPASAPSSSPASAGIAPSSAASGNAARSGWLFAGGLVAVLLICGGLVSLCHQGDRTEDTSGSLPDPAAPSPPTPPFVADTLVGEGLARLGGSYVLETIAIEYVRSDGTLDPTYGRISVESTHAPEPPPPDDPSRPTGAPTDDGSRALAMMMSSCPRPRWTPTDGWTVDDGPCITMGQVPTGRPSCSAKALWAMARQEDAPEGLAKITARWFIDTSNVRDGMRWEWIWTFDLRDSPRGVAFQHEFPDRLCK
jgi:hypothetical protein